MNKTKGIICGLVIIIFGLLFGLREADILSFDIFFDGWWTLFIIIPCTVGLITDKRNKTPHLIGIIIGVILLVRNYVDLSEYKGYIFPACVVLVGIIIIFNSFSSKKESITAGSNADGFTVENFVPSDSADKNEYYAVFSGKDLRPQGVFTGGRFTATFGGLKLDLRNADIADNCVIDVSATFGGVDIIMPYDVRVVVKSNSIFGGTGDKTNKNVPADAKTVYINAVNLFGGTDIK